MRRYAVYEQIVDLGATHALHYDILMWETRFTLKEGKMVKHLEAQQDYKYSFSINDEQLVFIQLS